MFIKQDPMRKVVYSLAPIFLWSIWLYGWRSVVVTAVVFLLGILTEMVVEKSRNKKVSEAVWVTAALFSLSLPPAVPLWVAAVGIVFAILIGKEAYGGFGRNIFNPAIAGRMFTYISFPLLMQTTWMFPGFAGTLGINVQVLPSVWTEAVFFLIISIVAFLIIKAKPEDKKRVIVTSLGATALVIAFYIVSAYTGWRGNGQLEVDAIATATPLELFRGLGADWNPPASLAYLKENNLVNMFFGLRVGSIGEGPIFLIILAGIYLVWNRVANWKMIVSTLLSALILTVIFYYTGLMKAKLPLLDPSGKDILAQLSDIAAFMMAGSLFFVAVFMATDPVTAPKKPLSQWFYGFLIGGVTIVVRCFSAFPEGVSFGILTANTFAALLDELLPAKKKAAPKAEVKA